MLRSEGQRRLAEWDGSKAELAARVGVSFQTLYRWCSGAKNPSPESRAKLEADIGIPASAWGEEAAGSVPEAGAGSAGPTSLAECMELLTYVRAQRTRAGLTANERLKFLAQERAVLSLRHDMESDAEMLESRVVFEHPTWRKIRAGLVAVLGPHPAAAAAVVEMLTAMMAEGERE